MSLSLHPPLPIDCTMKFACLPLPNTNQLFTVSLLTIVALTVTIAMHCFYGLNAALNTGLNASLAVLWAVSFALLSWWSSGTLAHVCNIDAWGSDGGISVCRWYKVLFSFALFGLASTLLALALDVRVQRSAINRGEFQQLDTLEKSGETDVHMQCYVGAVQIGNGYTQPEQQCAYDESYAYTGSAGQMCRRSLDERL